MTIDIRRWPARISYARARARSTSHGRNPSLESPRVAAVCSDRDPLGLPALPRPATRRKAHSPVVRGRARGVECVHGVLSVGPVRRLSVRAPVDHPRPFPPSTLDPWRARGRRSRGAPGTARCVLATRGRRGSRSPHLPDVDQQRRSAFRRARGHGTDRAGAVRKALPRPLALPALRAVELWLARRAAVLSIRARAVAIAVDRVSALVRGLRDLVRVGARVCVARGIARIRVERADSIGGGSGAAQHAGASQHRAARRVARTSGLRGRAADGRDESVVPRRGERAAALGRSARPLSDDVHPLLRVRAQSPSGSVRRPDPARADLGCRAQLRQRRNPLERLRDRPHLRRDPQPDRAALCRLHAAARNAPAAAATRRAAHRLLPLDLGRRCARRRLRRTARADPLQRLRRAAARNAGLVGRDRRAGLARRRAIGTPPPRIRRGVPLPRRAERRPARLRPRSQLPSSRSAPSSACCAYASSIRAIRSATSRFS